MTEIGERAVPRRGARMMAAAGAAASVLLGMMAFAVPASAHAAAPVYDVRRLLSGQSLHHWYTRAGSKKQHREALTQPDDITKTVRLGLTDPDSNEVVPPAAPRFSGDFMLTSQGDREQIYAHGAGTRHQHLSVLALSQSVDDTAWATAWHGSFYATDHDAGTVNVIAGTFWPGTALVAVTPCDAGNAPATCPAPGFPPNYLGHLNMYTGQITRVRLRGVGLQPQGLIFVAS